MSKNKKNEKPQDILTEDPNLKLQQLKEKINKNSANINNLSNLNSRYGLPLLFTIGIIAVAAIMIVSGAAFPAVAIVAASLTIAAVATIGGVALYSSYLNQQNNNMQRNTELMEKELQLGKFNDLEKSQGISEEKTNKLAVNFDIGSNVIRSLGQTEKEGEQKAEFSKVVKELANKFKGDDKLPKESNIPNPGNKSKDTEILSVKEKAANIVNPGNKSQDISKDTEILSVKEKAANIAKQLGGGTKVVDGFKMSSKEAKAEKGVKISKSESKAEETTTPPTTPNKPSNGKSTSRSPS